MERISFDIYDKFSQFRYPFGNNIIINNIKYKVCMIEFKIIKGYEYICKKRDGIPCILTLFDVGKQCEIILVFMKHRMSKYGRIILFDVDLSLILSPKEISHIKKYWRIRNKINLSNSQYDYIQYLDNEYNNFLNKISLNLTNNEYPNNEYPNNLYQFLHFGIFEKDEKDEKIEEIKLKLLI